MDVGMINFFVDLDKEGEPTHHRVELSIVPGPASATFAMMLGTLVKAWEDDPITLVAFAESIIRGNVIPIHATDDEQRATGEDQEEDDGSNRPH